jgi:transcription elongation factor Elf1
MLTIKMKDQFQFICPYCNHEDISTNLKDGKFCPSCNMNFQTAWSRNCQKRKAISDTNRRLRVIEGVLRGDVLDHA